MSLLRGPLRGQRGSAAYSMFGWAIIAFVVIVGIFSIPDFYRTKPPKDVDVLAGNKALAEKNWDRATAAFDKALKVNPKNADALAGRSRAYVQLGKLDPAIEDAKAAAEADRGNAAALAQNAFFLKMQGKRDEAEKEFSAAIGADSSNAWALAQRADLRMKRGKLPEALADVDRALAAKKDFADAYRLRAWINARSGKCKEALVDFEQVEKLGSKDAFAIQDKAWFLLTCDEKFQDPVKAFELAQKAEKMAGAANDGVFTETLAEAYFKQYNYAKAVELQTKAVELAKNKNPVGSVLAEMQGRLQKYELAARQEIRKEVEVLSSEGGR